MTDYAKLKDAELLDCVDHAGRSLPPELIRVLLARWIDLRGVILERFAESINDDWADSNDPRWYRAVHYGFLLIAYRERKSLPIFATVYSDSDRYDALLEWFEQAPAHFGPAAVPVFQGVIENARGAGWDFGAALSIAIVEEIAMHFPETRPAVVTFLRSLLPAMAADGRVVLDDEDEIDELWGSVVDALAELHDRGSMPQVLAMFDAELIDPMEIDRETYLDVLEGRHSTAKTPPFDIFAIYTEVARRDQMQAGHKP